MSHQMSQASYLQYALECLSGRPRRSERFSHSVLRAVERRYASIRQADLFADIGGGCAADATAGEAAPASDTTSSDDDDGGDPDADPDSDPASDPPALSPCHIARQSAAFRTTLTGVPGIVCDQKGGSFRASYVASDGKPTRIGYFQTIGAALIAIKRAYASSEVTA